MNGLRPPTIEISVTRSGPSQRRGAAWLQPTSSARTSRRLARRECLTRHLHDAGRGAAFGRGFTADEDRAGAERVVVLSHEFWQRRFGADPAIIGKNLTLSGESFTVIGVMPRSFSFPILTGTEIWRTVTPVLAAQPGCDRGCVILRLIARLKTGVTLDAARAEMNAINHQMAERYPDTNQGVGSTLVTLHEQLVGDVRPAMLVLLSAVALVLLIACANVANLLLARAAAREKEVAIRAALGATRKRLIRQHLTESLLLAVLGGAFGLLMAFWMVDLLVSFAPDGTPRLDEIAIDKSVLAFTFGVAVLTGLYLVWRRRCCLRGRTSTAR